MELQKKLAGNIRLIINEARSRVRNFYLAFPKFDALRQELSWTHYRILSRIENESLFASKYRLYLPSEEELKQLIEHDRIQFELNQKFKQ